MRLFLLAALAALALPVAASAQPRAIPDPVALDLARYLMQRDPSLYDDADVVRFQARIQRDLTALPAGCDPFNNDCQGAAIIVARQFAAPYRESERRRAEAVTALLLQDSLHPEEMRHILVWLQSGEGGHFLDAIGMLRDPDRSRRRREQLARQVALGGPDPLDAARTLFLQRTHNLPRARPIPR